MSTPEQSPYSPPPAYSFGADGGSDASQSGRSQPQTLTVEVDEGEVWPTCSCGWTRSFASGVAWGELAWHVSQHADTHRKNSPTCAPREMRTRSWEPWLNLRPYWLWRVTRWIKP